MTRPRDAQLPLLLTMSEGLSRGPDEMVPVSPNDSMHPPSCGLAIRDAVEEIKWLRAEVERLRAEMLELAEWCEAEEPLSHKKLSYRLRYAQEAKP